jgi:LPXTG-motif cell wall-anchored protein
MRFKLLTLALVAGFLIAAVPAVAQDNTGSYTSTTPTVSTPSAAPETPATTDTSTVSPAESNGNAAAPASGTLAQTGSDTWVLLAIGGALALGSALLLVRERRPRNR